LPGMSIASNGTTPADEVATVGNIPLRAESILQHGDTPGIIFASPSARYMVLAAAQALDALANRLGAVAPTSQIIVQFAWDPTPSNIDLHGQGRALDVILATPDPRVDLGLLGALAHEIGIAYVRYDISTFLPFLRITPAPGLDLDLRGPDVVFPGQSV